MVGDSQHWPFGAESRTLVSYIAVSYCVGIGVVYWSTSVIIFVYRLLPRYWSSALEQTNKKL
jgi:hypothetical protein